jgi:hypothetical protein
MRVDDVCSIPYDCAPQLIRSNKIELPARRRRDDLEATIGRTPRELIGLTRNDNGTMAALPHPSGEP